MITIGNESQKVRLEQIIRNDIIKPLQTITGPLSENLVEFLILNCKLLIVSKDQYLEESTSYEDGKLFYMYKGIARSLYYDPLNHKPVISRIWTKHDIIFDVNSFQNKADRLDSIRMLEDGELLCISYQRLNNFFEQFPKMVPCLLWLQAEREKHAQFYQHLLKLNVEERVRRYLNHYPGIISRISHDNIALHLGMNRSRLSLAYKNYKQEVEGS
jgi:CRP-like cAMP-binding protein